MDYDILKVIARDNTDADPELKNILYLLWLILWTISTNPLSKSFIVDFCPSRASRCHHLIPAGGVRCQRPKSRPRKVIHGSRVTAGDIMQFNIQKNLIPHVH